MEEQVAEIPGKLLKDQIYTGKVFEPGTKWIYHTYLAPAALALKRREKPMALYVLLEHTAEVMSPMLSNFMDEGLMPPGLVLYAYPGVLEPAQPDGEARNMRTEEFDEFSREFPDLLVEELIPEAVKLTGVTLDPSPDMHFITGGSSGGTMAWNAVWFRTDYFRRTFLSSPTFAAERGGDETLTLVRKTETKPIRIYMTAGTEEPAGVDGSSLYCALSAADTFEFAGYDFRFEQFTGEGHCCRRQDPTLWRRIVRFIWANWFSDPVVKPLFNQIRISKFLVPGSKWEKYKGVMPEKAPLETPFGTYSFEGGSIYLTKGGKRTLAASGFGQITGMAISADGWRLYFADLTRRYIFALSIMEKGKLGQLCKMAPVCLLHDCRQLGAVDVTVLPDNRVMAATEMGVQGVWKTGMIDMILPLPDDAPVTAVGYKKGMLYATDGKTVYRRKIRGKAVPFLGNSCRSHLIP